MYSKQYPPINTRALSQQFALVPDLCLGKPVLVPSPMKKTAQK